MIYRHIFHHVANMHVAYSRHANTVREFYPESTLVLSRPVFRDELDQGLSLRSGRMQQENELTLKYDEYFYVLKKLVDNLPSASRANLSAQYECSRAIMAVFEQIMESHLFGLTPFMLSMIYSFAVLFRVDPGMILERQGTTLRGFCIRYSRTHPNFTANFNFIPSQVST